MSESFPSSQKGAFPGSETSSSQSIVSATAWLEQICQENVAYLQRSLPIAGKPSKKKQRKQPSLQWAGAVLWGIGAIESQIEEGPEVLDRLIQAYVSQPLIGTSLVDAKATAAHELRLKTCENIGRWITRSLPVHGEDPYVALAGASWIHGLSELGSALSPHLWLEVLQSILTQVERALNDKSPSQLLPWLVWSCEIPLALATQLSQLGGKDRMVIDTLDRLALLLEASSDDPTLWIQHGGRDLRALLASAIRCRWSADRLGARSWYAPQRKAIAKLAKIALSLSDADGLPLLVEQATESDDRELWLALIEISAPNKGLESLHATVFPGRRLARSDRSGSGRSKRSKSALDVRLPEPGRHFEKAELATMRRSWKEAGFRIAVDYARDPMWIDCVGEGGLRLFSGEWDVVVRLEGEPMETDIGWSEVCWFSDDDVDYLEIESAVEGKCRIQRQIMLVRQEGLMFFSDTLLAEESGHWSVDSIWELADGIEFRSAAKTHEAELYLGSEKSPRSGLLLPLGLPEWRRSPSRGKLVGEQGRVVLHQEVDGNRIYNPLVLSSRKAAKKLPYTWRHLTVAQDLEIQPPHVAQAYRVQIGKEQLVFYRSLEKTVRRTAMGLHLNSEFYAGRFDASEAVYESVVEINADD